MHQHSSGINQPPPDSTNHSCFAWHDYHPWTCSKDNECNARMLPQFLNSLGCVNYDQNGRVPWKTMNECSKVYISEKYKSITKFLAIDCETVGVGEPPVKTLGRVSIVNEYGYCLYDTFVNPMVKITDYGTQYSGIRPENIKIAPPINIVLKKVAELVKGKILVGHSIHHDLRVLRVKGYESIRDSAAFFKEMTKANQLSSLKTLAKEYLNATIQTGEHNSIEDAQAAMKLYRVFQETWEKSLNQNKIKYPCGHTEKVSSDADTTKLKCRMKLLKVLPCRHHVTLPCHESPLTVKCTICVVKDELIAQAGPPKEIDATVAKIPPKFLNSIGLINYDHYGKVPWTKKESSEIFLSPKFKSVTPFLGIDCEMVGTGARGHISTLGRVSIVNEYGYCVYDTFVNTVVKITDYRTKYSGIRAEDIVKAPSKNDVLQRVAQLVKGKTLVGHDIGNDLRVLYMNGHPAIRDTAKYFKEQTKAKQMPSLKELTRDYLNGTIQMGEHSSIEDAQATMKLYSVYHEKWEEYLVSNPNHMEIKKGKATLPCGHKRKVPQGTEISSVKCDKNVKKYLPCGHQKKAPCHQIPSAVPCDLCAAKNKVTIKTEAAHSSTLPTPILSTKPCGQSRPDVLNQSSSNNNRRRNVKNCQTMVFKTLYCGHSQQCKSGENIGNVRCTTIVTKQLPCGHDKKAECGQNMNTLSCEYIVTMKCFKLNIEESPMSKLNVLNCVHTREVPCKQVSQFKCPTIVTKHFPCGHQEKVECYKTLSNLECDICAKKNPATTKISLPTSGTNEPLKNLRPCGHLPVVVSIQPSDNIVRPKRRNAKCKVNVTRNLPCGHEKLVQCSKKISKIKCKELVKKNLECGHEKTFPCHQTPSTIKCDTCIASKSVSPPVSSELPIIQNISSEKLPCGHSPVIMPNAEASTSKAKCKVKVTKTFSCGHSKELKCCSLEGYKCQEMKKIRLICGHEQEVVCSLKLSKVKCKNMKTVHLPCLHQQEIPCGQNSFEVKCTTNVVINLPCGHKTMSHCHQSLSTIKCAFCEEVVDSQQLPCGHSSDVLASQKKKSKVKCMVVVTKTLSCSHVATAACHMFTDAYICREIGNKILICGHEKQVPCNKSVYTVKCIQLVTKNLPCGHQQKSHCYQAESTIKCVQVVTKNLPCGHQQRSHCHQAESTIKCNLCNIVKN